MCSAVCPQAHFLSLLQCIVSTRQSVSLFVCSSMQFNHRTISEPLCLQEWCRGPDQHQGGVHRCRRTDTGQSGEGGETHSDCCIWGLRVGHWGCHASPHTPPTTSHAAWNAITQQVLHITLQNSHDAAESCKSSVLTHGCFQLFCDS